MYTDTHAHLSSDEMSRDLDQILQRAQERGVTKIVNICTDDKTLTTGLILQKKHPWIYLAAATTPHDVEQEGSSFFPIVQQCAEAGALVAIGETGLDYYYEHASRKTQQAFLCKYFELASHVQLPLIFHCRDAFHDLFALADQRYIGKKGLLHCFTGSLEEAQGVVDRGWYLSFSGVITFKKSQALREVIPYIPLDRLLVETDSPYLAPQSRRGRLNEPSYMIETIAVMGGILSKTIEEMGKITADNAERFFSFSKLTRDV